MHVGVFWGNLRSASRGVIEGQRRGCREKLAYRSSLYFHEKRSLNFHPFGVLSGSWDFSLGWGVVEEFLVGFWFSVPDVEMGFLVAQMPLPLPPSAELRGV